MHTPTAVEIRNEIATIDSSAIDSIGRHEPRPVCGILSNIQLEPADDRRERESRARFASRQPPAAGLMAYTRTRRPRRARGARHGSKADRRPPPIRLSGWWAAIRPHVLRSGREGRPGYVAARGTPRREEAGAAALAWRSLGSEAGVTRTARSPNLGPSFEGARAKYQTKRCACLPHPGIVACRWTRRQERGESPNWLAERPLAVRGSGQADRRPGRDSWTLQSTTRRPVYADRPGRVANITRMLTGGVNYRLKRCPEGGDRPGPSRTILQGSTPSTAFHT